MGKVAIGIGLGLGAVGGCAAAYNLTHIQQNNAYEEVQYLEECLNGDRQITAGELKLNKSIVLYCGDVVVEEVAEDINNDGTLERVTDLDGQLAESKDYAEHYYSRKGIFIYPPFISLALAFGGLAGAFVSGGIKPPKRPRLHQEDTRATKVILK